MKNKVFMMIAMAFMAIGAEAQKIISEIDWTKEKNYDEQYFCDCMTMSLTDDGLIILTEEGKEYWEPQVAIIYHIPELNKGRHYLVKFTVDAPAAGEIRLDFCSWDGSGASMAPVINVEPGEKEYTIDFPDYPKDCTDAMLFYQCGHLPGKHVIKIVQVLELETATDNSAKTSNAQQGYWNGVEHIELVPDDSFVYRYVQAMDEDSEKTLNDLCDKMEESGDNSILKRRDMEYYARNDYSLPEGDYYESYIYKSYDGSHFVVRPGIMVYLREGFQIDALLEYLGDKVRVDIYEDDNPEGLFVSYVLACQVRTSDEVMEIINAMHEFGLEGMSYCYMPLMWGLDTFAANKLKGLDEESEDEIGPRLIAEIDWTMRDYLEFWDMGDIYAVQGVGLIINSNPADGAAYWEPQVPMIGHIPEFKKGGHYLVKFTIDTPAAGEIRLDLCSWDGTEGATKALIINVEVGEKEYTVDFLDYPTTCTDGMIFYQCGHLPGQHIIKKVQVFKIEYAGTNGNETTINATKTTMSQGTIYNLAGQKVNASYKGLVIQNGKKRIVH